MLPLIGIAAYRSLLRIEEPHYPKKVSPGPRAAARPMPHHIRGAPRPACRSATLGQRFCTTPPERARPLASSDGAKDGPARSSRGLGAAAAAWLVGPVDPALSEALSPKHAEDLFGRTAVTGSRAFGSGRRGPRLTGLTSLAGPCAVAGRRSIVVPVMCGYFSLMLPLAYISLCAP